MQRKAILALPLFCSAILISAALIFWIQPLFTKAALPLLGGAPSVWNVAMVCFQTLLLAGYWYADRLTRLPSPRWQAWVHALLVIAALAWIWTRGQGDMPPAGQEPSLWLMQALLMQIGLPFFLLATTSTLLQRWYAGLAPGGEVYWLYVVSNAGSMIGVLGFIVVLEPALGLAGQGIWFRAGFTILALLLLAVAAYYGLRAHRLLNTETVSHALTWRPKCHWLLLAAVPSGLLLSTTTHITMEIAPMPLLWMLLLALYLLSFILAFSSWKRLNLSFLLKLQMVLCIPLLADFFLDVVSAGGLSVMAWHMAAFFVTATICHRLLYQSRPPAEQLTSFYLYLAIGGAVGGMTVTFIAPLFFDSLLEYPLFYAAALALRPAVVPLATTWRKDIAIGGLVLMLLVLGFYLMKPLLFPLRPEIIGVLLAIAIIIAKFCFDQESRPLRLACCFAAAVIAGTVLDGMRNKSLEAVRNFYGVITVDGEGGDAFSMRHGTTVHGTQYMVPEKRLIPLTYYHPSGPLGDLMRAPTAGKKTLRIAAIGLGLGSLACYARSQDMLTFFEINPAVIALANDTRYFSFLRDCPPKIRMVEADGRLGMQAEAGPFDIIVLDAFTSDAIPVHLLTSQAFDLYKSRLAPGGVIMVHISNRYLDLSRVLKAIADDQQLALKTWNDDASSSERHRQPSRWAVMGDRQSVDRLQLPARWQEIDSGHSADLWSDDYSNIFRLLQWK